MATREILECWTTLGTLEARMAKRARIMLMAAVGAVQPRDRHTRRFALQPGRHLAPALRRVWPCGSEDEERSGRPVVYGHDDVLLLVKLVTEPPPGSATRWSMEALATAMAGHGVPISASQVWRICSSLDLKPWQVESWMTSHDPDFWEKAGDICGLVSESPRERCGLERRREIRHAGHLPRQPDPPRCSGHLYPP